MFGKKWYIEVLIIALILPVISIGISMLVPSPLSWLIYLILVIAVIIWRIRKKALKVKEAITIVIILYGLNFICRILLPYPLSFLVPLPFVFLIVWLIHKETGI